MVTTTTTTFPEADLDPELNTFLDELDQLWTPECESAVCVQAEKVIELVTEWNPTLLQGLGDFGGDLATLREGFTPTDPACPDAGYVVRFLTLVDNSTPPGQPNLLLGIYPFVEPSLTYISWQ